MPTSLIDQIDELQKNLQRRRPLNEGELRELRKWYDVSYTYHSNAIEGNSLTLGETKIIIEEGLTIGGKPLKEILEVKNHKHVLDQVFDLVKSHIPLTEKMLTELHRGLLYDIDSENAGVYRRIQVYISGSEEPLPKSGDVPGLMKELFAWYERESKKSHPCVLAAELHYRFVKIHPFVDGNGRIARFLVNIVLLQNNFPPMIVPVVRRAEYIQNIQKGELAFTEFMLSAIKESLKDYLRMIETN